MREPHYYPINDEAARTAHQANSFRAFRSDEPEYRQQVDAAYELADAAAERDPDRAEEAYELADRFAWKYADWLNKGYTIEAMCPSVMVSGAGNFPVRKKQRQNRRREAHMTERSKIIALREKIKKIGDPHAPIKAGDEKAVEKLREKVARLEAEHERMKTENRDARKEGREAPFPGWKLANNRQVIKETKKRLESLEAAKAEGTKRRDAEIMGEPVEIVENADAMRLQIIFNGKPPEDVRTALKKHGFRWSPKAGAWQRQLNGNARHALERLEVAS